MGNLLRILYAKDTDTNKSDIFLDFENAQPTSSEAEVYDVVKAVLDQSTQILEDLNDYQGANEPIRVAISNPTNEGLQEEAWRAVMPLVGQLKKFYEYATELEAALPQLLNALCSEINTSQHLEQQQALAKQFADILHFTLKFDDLKMTNPSIQNDFSYYRRTLSRRKLSNCDDNDMDENDVQVSNEMANRMSLFYAYPTPMLKTLSDATSKFVSENKNLPIENTTDMLSTLANLCRVMIENPEYSSRFESQETTLFCLRIMVGVIILYDHVHPLGAFVKTSNIDMKATIKVLKDQPLNSVEGLLNALRYTTKHLNDESTPRNIRMLLQQ
ncbi:LOW QUALITY PROTEIN: CYFIP-related Rac1 interactor B-like [Xenia sp. Carnegie-2017]|uniref:LOW QUALITY PROTEIN: CYFIP-related Rac1 interactor B-like n=1 Tax=Xenia sp. Carnegie-2017 TaxID=2897299 RepID=UPI001F033318|nr:LOW QUALITY PROTEIN: CYFIP-related Rac1 interactor B-like [Xenia sp. Carnegie-2017]